MEKKAQQVPLIDLCALITKSGRCGFGTKAVSGVLHGKQEYWRFCRQVWVRVFDWLQLRVTGVVGGALIWNLGSDLASLCADGPTSLYVAWQLEVGMGMRMLMAHLCPADTVCYAGQRCISFLWGFVDFVLLAFPMMTHSFCWHVVTLPRCQQSN
jgi:hypothetical protein